MKYGQWLARPEGKYPQLEGLDSVAARSRLESVEVPPLLGRWLPPEAVEGLLGAYGIPVLESRFATSADQAVLAANELGYPVALKLVSETITHKTDVGGVYLDLKESDAVALAFEAVSAALEKAGKLEEMSGVMLQRMAPEGIETFVGITQDPSYGTLLGFGIGGINVEIWKDVVFRVNPITDVDAADMVEGIRGVKLLHGVRGRKPADREALADALLRVGRMVQDLPEILEMDINPLVALEPGRGVVAVDARIRVKG